MTTYFKNKIQADVIDDVILERNRQDRKFGLQEKEPFNWLAIIMEELGEASEAALEGNARNYRKELIEVAASVINAVECLDRWHTKK
jgi:NTP pyrophosphatase (non-canonical NTP hydrolase)